MVFDKDRYEHFILLYCKKKNKQNPRQERLKAVFMEINDVLAYNISF